MSTRTLVTRVVVWSFAILAGIAAIVATRPATHRLPQAPISSVLYGVRSSIDEGRYPMACTEEQLFGQQWRCMAWSIDTTNAVIVAPKPYSGPCTHMHVDQELGRWVCLGETTYPPLGDGSNA